MEKMNPEVKAAWVAALRSGEYKQGKHVLRDEGNQYCCLGVLCDLYAKATSVDFDQTPENNNGTHPSASVNRWAGLTNTPRLSINGLEDAVTDHNDGTSIRGIKRQATFAEIADAIEAQL